MTTNPADHPTEKHDSGNPKQFIQLTSKVSSQIAGFVLGNSICRTCHKLPIRRKDRTKPINAPVCMCEVPNQIPVVAPQSLLGTGREVIICGSGPSLKKVKKLIRRHPKADVWGCNDALIWLTKKKIRVTHGMAIDQSPDLYETCWADPPDVPYYLATSVDWRLVEHLAKHGRLHNITFFHSFVGFESEYELYAMLYPITLVAGNGLNVVNRAIDLAEVMAYKTVYLIGVDCALGPGDIFHAGESQAETGIILRGKIDGKMWATKPDMLVSAIDIAKQKKRLGPRLQFVGNSLPRALQDKDDKFLERCIRWVAADELPSTNTSSLTTISVMP